MGRMEGGVDCLSGSREDSLPPYYAPTGRLSVTGVVMDAPTIFLCFYKCWQPRKSAAQAHHTRS